MKRILLFLFGLPGLILIGMLLYWGVLLLFFGYELSTSEGAVKRLTTRAIAERNPSICKKIIHPEIMPADPSRYDLVNGCRGAYAAATGDVSVCMNAMSPGNCVQRAAKERNDPELCAQAIDPRRQGTDDRGSCFGYFAGRERDYGWCERLKEIPNLPAGEHKSCISNYIGRDKSQINVSLCAPISDPELKKFCVARVQNSL